MAIPIQALLAEDTSSAGNIERHQNVVADLQFLDLLAELLPTPVNSWPNVIPTRVSGTDPLYKCRSDPQIHDRVIRTMAS